MKNKIALLKTLVQNNDADALNVFNTATAEVLLSEDEGVQVQLMAGWWMRLQKEVPGMSSSIDLFQVIKLGYSLKTKLDKLSNEQKEVIAKAITEALEDETFRKESAVVFLEYIVGRVQLSTLIKSAVDSVLLKLADVDELKPFMGDITHVLKLALPLLVTAVKSTDMLLGWSGRWVDDTDYSVQRCIRGIPDVIVSHPYGPILNPESPEVKAQIERFKSIFG